MKTRKAVANLLRTSLVNMIVLGNQMLSRSAHKRDRWQEVRLATVDGIKLCTWVQAG